MALNYLVALYQLMTSPTKFNFAMSILQGSDKVREWSKNGGVWPTLFSFGSGGVSFNTSGIENPLDFVLKANTSNVLLLFFNLQDRVLINTGICSESRQVQLAKNRNLNYKITRLTSPSQTAQKFDPFPAVFISLLPPHS